MNFKKEVIEKTPYLVSTREVLDTLGDGVSVEKEFQT